MGKLAIAFAVSLAAIVVSSNPGLFQPFDHTGRFFFAFPVLNSGQYCSASRDMPVVAC